MGDVIARRRVAREPPESRGRVRPSVALSATAAGLLGVTLIMHACDPLGTQIATALPTFLGAREHVQDLRTRMDLHEALAAMESYRADNGTFAGFDAATGRGIDPALEWSEKPWTGIESPPSVSIAKASGSQATLLAFSTSGSAFCLEEQTGSRPTYGSAALGSGTSPAEAIAAATALCGSTPWNASALKPFPVDSLCAGQIDGAIVMCRAVQRYLRQTLASPS